MQMFGCLPTTRKANSRVPSSAAALSLSDSSSYLLLPYGALGEREGLAFFGVFWKFLCWNYWCSVPCHLCHPPSFFSFRFYPLSSVIAAPKFIIILKVLSSHPHSMAETMKKAGMCLMTHEINNPCKQLVGKMSHMSLFWKLGVFQKAGSKRRCVKTDTRVCIRTWENLWKLLSDLFFSVCGVAGKSTQWAWISLQLFQYREVFFFSEKVFLRVVCSGKCCKLSNILQLLYCLAFLLILELVREKKKENNQVLFLMSFISITCQGMKAYWFVVAA